MNNDAAAKLVLEIDQLKDKLNKIEVRKEQLNQVVAPTMTWMDNQKSEAQKWSDSHKKEVAFFQDKFWKSSIGDSGLAQLKNDRYKISKAELYCEDIFAAKLIFKSTIQVLDLDLKTENDGETILKDLKQQSTDLENQRQDKVKRGISSLTLTNDVVQYCQEWAVSDKGNNNYAVSGPGLGMSPALTRGRWIYDTASKKLSPDSAASETLQKALLIQQ
jgi:hypothetical protein